MPWSPAGSAEGLGLKLLGPIRYIDSRHEALAPFPHCFLSLIGVAPGLPGRGYAGALLRPDAGIVTPRKLPCYLETMVERNVARYEHFGFRVFEQSAVPGTRLTSWAMLRGNPPQMR